MAIMEFIRMKLRVLGALNERLHPSPSHVEGLDKVSGLSIQK